MIITAEHTRDAAEIAIIAASVRDPAHPSPRPRAVRIVQLNLAFDPAIAAPAQLLDRYHTLTGWSRALARTGAAVHVVQRFSQPAALGLDGVEYTFVPEGEAGIPGAWTVLPRVVETIRRASPDVVHLNGLMFPGMMLAIRDALGKAVAVVVQDHSGARPRPLPAPLGWMQQRRWSEAFHAVDACTFTARALAGPWRRIGLPGDTPVLEIPEASTSLAPMARADAQARTGMRGGPALLWVGRLDGNKDPQTVLAGLAQWLPDWPEARVWMVGPGGAHEAKVRAQIAASPVLRERVSLVGPVAHADMAAYYSAADVLVSGSQHEGSGYALIEGMACGVVPCVTGIPAFRALAGDCGVLWRAGDADDLRRALDELMKRSLEVERARVRRRFAECLGWPVIGRRTRDAYEELLAARRRQSV